MDAHNRYREEELEEENQKEPVEEELKEPVEEEKSEETSNDEELTELKEEIKKWGEHSYFTTSTGERIGRIAYGDEYIHCHNDRSEFYEVYRRQFCDDCGAKLGEFHMPYCDFEVCPICKGQKLSCNCDLFLEGLDEEDDKE